jgi:hypothetical protein
MSNSTAVLTKTMARSSRGWGINPAAAYMDEQFLFAIMKE